MARSVALSGMNPASERMSHGTDPDREAGLVRAAQGGDSKAFAEIVRIYQRPIYRVAYGLTRNPGDADDLAQETFVRAWKALDRFRVGEPLYPWLSRIAVNLAYSLFRSRKRKPETALEPLVEAGRQWAAEDDPVQEVEGGEQRERLQEAFATLKPEHQAVLTLRAVEGMSYDEIASALNVPAGTVMSRLSRARAELKAKLKARTGEG
jgi:RNA polymerase sigma-70 factor (ECF subfamily)